MWISTYDNVGKTMFFFKRLLILTCSIFISFILALFWFWFISGPPGLVHAGSVKDTDTSFVDEESIRFAIIGDYDNGSDNEAKVASLVIGWNPELILTTGDNNYPDGTAETIDKNIGQFYSQFIGNYQGNYGTGSDTNGFWPSLGNHDWHSINCDTTECTGPYFDYFTLPGNERYYDVNLGLVHIYAINSVSQEPDGNNMYSTSANSGLPISVTAGESIQSEIIPGTLEMSNVNLAQEFSDMILAQRGFQANARVITTRS